jgi:DNA-directed RNA polymerase specialized sigma54-like protein
MIDVEDDKNPLSDQEIAEKLGEMNIHVSRRVVAKYRKAKGILNSRLRRKE